MDFSLACANSSLAFLASSRYLNNSSSHYWTEGLSPNTFEGVAPNPIHHTLSCPSDPKTRVMISLGPVWRDLVVVCDSSTELGCKNVSLHILWSETLHIFCVLVNYFFPLSQYLFCFFFLYKAVHWVSLTSLNLFSSTSSILSNPCFPYWWVADPSDKGLSTALRTNQDKQAKLSRGME